MAMMKVINKAEVMRKLGEIKDVKAKRAFELTRADIARRAPRLIAQVGSSAYAISAAKLNPNTKSGAGKSHVSAAGDTLMSLELVYRGQRLSVGGGGATWKTKPSGHRKNPYQIQGQILRGGASPYGHWSKPRSEGGAYGAVSPFMFLPGISVPIQRHGDVLDTVAKGLAVPQVVVSERTSKQLSSALEFMLLDRLEHHLARVLGD